ncbi:hypothetical protein DWY25_04405 [Holdemania filiformis]|uniref:Transmembrane protein n=1 Tax=Holdemania filiformis TaxID=61171 RepID=A0A412G483_9FIRM|nr:hypothetical protein DWY25_04405 [Holdemania filiformis]
MLDIGQFRLTCMTTIGMNSQNLKFFQNFRTIYIVWEVSISRNSRARRKMNKRKRDFTLWWIDHENEIQCSVMIVVLILKLLFIVVFAILLWKII